jgi:phosphatidate cytidylyltransferase
MLVGFLIILAAGQFYCMLFIIFLNVVIFTELNSIKRNEEKEQNIPLTKYFNWYIFAAVNYYSLGYFVADKIPILGSWYPTIGMLLAHHGFICFMLMVVGFLAFVLSLKHGYLKYQFRLFGWLMIHNLYEGLIWYILPAFLIISNDIFAYLVGYFFGRHQLIALSPKKTWEGYIGGAISTFFFSLIVSRNSYLSCPPHSNPSPGSPAKSSNPP